MGTLPAAQRHNPSGLNADAAIGYACFIPATKRYAGDSTTLKLRAYMKSLLYGFDRDNGSIEDLRHMAGRDGLLHQTPLKFSTARSDPNKGGYDPVTFCDCQHNTRYLAGTAGHIPFPLKAHETWMIVEPFDSNRPKRTTGLQAGFTTARQR